MRHPRIKRFEVQGFRSYGAEKQIAEIDAPIAVIWAPNSRGKTSFAEAIEFLLTGQTVKREILASRQDEFADALRNAHLPDGVETFVAVAIECADGSSVTIKRVLKKDYAKQKDCETELFIDDAPASETDLGRHGIVLSQPPLRSPVLAQHTLNYLFTAKPSDRAIYFKALLEVTDLDEFRSRIVALETTLSTGDSPILGKFAKASAIPSVSLTFHLVDTIDRASLQAAFEAGSAALLQGEGLPVPPTLAERTQALEQFLAARRSEIFPLELLSRVPFAPPAGPDSEFWTKLVRYVDEKAKIDGEVRRLIALFRAALTIPDISEAASELDCPLCGTQSALTPARIKFIRESVASTDSFQTAERDALAVLNELQSRVGSLSAAAAAALPSFARQIARTRRRAGFTVARIRLLLADADMVVRPWLASLRGLYRERRYLNVCLTRAKVLLNAYIAAPSDLGDVEPLAGCGKKVEA